MFNVAERIKYFREQKGLTVNGLANLAGISQSYLRDIELGNKTPTVEYLEYICDALKISLVSFFDVEDDGDEMKRLINSLSKEQQDSLKNLLKSIIN
jgi:transcriptional regulator with XRE-family HTH domain